MKYLGIPLISSQLKNCDCRDLVDRIMAKVKSWLSKYLSYAGRVQLIRVVLFAIQSYWSAIVFLSKVLLMKLLPSFVLFFGGVVSWGKEVLRSFGGMCAFLRMRVVWACVIFLIGTMLPCLNIFDTCSRIQISPF